MGVGADAARALQDIPRVWRCTAISSVSSTVVKGAASNAGCLVASHSMAMPQRIANIGGVDGCCSDHWGWRINISESDVEPLELLLNLNLSLVEVNNCNLAKDGCSLCGLVRGAYFELEQQKNQASASHPHAGEGRTRVQDWSGH